MTFTGFLMAAVIIFVALYFGYRAMYGEPRIDRDDPPAVLSKMQKARAKGKDHLYSLIKRKPKRAAIVHTQAEKASPKTFSQAHTAPLLTEAGEIGDVDGPDVSNAATRSAPLLATIGNTSRTDASHTDTDTHAPQFEKTTAKRGAGVVDFSQVAMRTAPLLTETGAIGDIGNIGHIDSPSVSHAPKRSQALPESHVQSLLQTGHGGSYQNRVSSAYAGDDTGGIAEGQGELPGLGSLITGIDVSSANTAGNRTTAPADSYIEGDGSMNHDEPYLGEGNRQK